MSLSKGVEYLQRAQECRDKALLQQSETERERWMRMAKEWEDLAEHYHPGANSEWIRNRAANTPPPPRSWLDDLHED